MIERLNRREKVLGAIVGGALFVLVNLFVVQFVLQNRTRLESELRTKKAELDSLESLFAERDLWASRTAWIETNQPVAQNPQEAGVKLLDEVKQTAQQNGVLVENPALGAAQSTPHYFSVPVTVETKSPWPALIGFLQSIQAPERFLVLESANLQVDPADPTQMRGRLRVARWYAPRQ